MKIDRTILKLMGFSFHDKRRTATLLLDVGDVLTALKQKDNTYIVRSCLSSLDTPLLNQKELIEYLAFTHITR